MRTSTPKVLGWISVLYALLIHAFYAFLPLITLAGLVMSWNTAGFDAKRFVLDLLPFVYFLFYFIGGIGLIMLRRRAALLVLLAAVSELIYDLGIYDIRDRLESAAGLSVMAALGSLSTFIIPAVIAIASWWVWHRFETLGVPSPGERKLPEAEPVAAQAVSSGKRYYLYMLIAVILFGMVIPVSTGIAVKLFLESLGEPTIPWSYFVNLFSLVLLVPLSVWWSIPYLVLVYAARNIRTQPIWGLKTYAARLVFVSSGFAGGALGSIWMFVNVFFEFDPLIILVPIWLYYVPHVVGGLLAGYLIAKGVEVYVDKRRNRM